MPAKLNTNIFKDRANKIHQDKYDYSLVRYTGSRERVEIICPMHGIFQQRADTHLQGIGCNLCSISNQTYHHNDFVEKAHKVHNYKYEYMGVYTISNNEIEIKCPVHGLFMQKAAAHLRGQGCPKCAIDNRSAKQNLTHEEFLEKVNVIYDNKYQYLTKYINCRSKIEVHCPSHGKFSLLANNHMHGQGCPDCSEKIRIQNIRLSTKEFVDRAKIVHNGKYQYVDDYVSSYFKIKISCPLHGIFQQLPSSHLHGQGCPKCKKYVSKPETLWLDMLGITDANRQITLVINSKNVRVDGFNPDTNTVYEFYGDYWHGNINKYDAKRINQSTNTTFEQLFTKTVEREKLIKSAGYNLVTMWESDFKKSKI